MTVPGQDPATSAGETPANPPATPVTPPVATGSDGEPFDAARAQRTIDALRDEVRTLKPQAQAGKTAQQRLQELEDAQKSDLEKATARADALAAQLATEQTARREERIRSAVLVTASILSYADPEDAYPLLQAARMVVETNEAGEPTNVKKLLEDLLKAKPHLAKVAGGTAPINGPPRQNGAAPTREALIEDKKKALLGSGSYTRF